MYKKDERSNSTKRSESSKTSGAKSSDSSVGHESKTVTASTNTPSNKATVGVQTETEDEETILPDLLEGIVASSGKDQVTKLQYSHTSKELKVTRGSKKVHVYSRCVNVKYYFALY